MQCDVTETKSWSVKKHAFWQTDVRRHMSMAPKQMDS
jgi:hypothetical protein